MVTRQKKIGLRERQLIMVEHNQYSLAGVVHLIREIVKIIFLIEIIGGFIFTAYIMRFYDSFSEALLNGMFMSVSATTNAGFDITGTSLTQYFNDYFIQTLTMILIILGAIGFPVLIEVKSLFFKKSASFPFFIIHKNNDSDVWDFTRFRGGHDFYFGIDAFIQRNGMA